MDERRGDWEHGVDENLASLNTGQRVSDRLIEDLELKYEAIDKVIRGDAEADMDGLVARLHALETTVREIQAATIKVKIDDVEIRKSKWEFSGRILERLLILAVVLLLGWERLAPLYKKLLMRQASDPVEQLIENTKHPKGKHRHVTIRRVPDESEAEP